MPEFCTPNFKTDSYGVCECGCGLEGRLKKPSRDGTRCVANRCRCRRCLGRKSANAGRRSQNRGAKRLGLITGKFAPKDEENLGGPVRYENKKGGFARPVATAYERERRQADAAKSIGDPRPFVAGYEPNGSEHTYYVIRDDALEAVVFALAAAWGFGEP